MRDGDRPVLDHVVVVVPAAFLAMPPSWLTNEFTVLPGGRHTGGLTENRLVVFSDGTYIELIAFAADADPERRRSHFWGRKEDGTVADFALSLHTDAHPSQPLPSGGDGPSGGRGDAEVAFEDVQERVRRADCSVVYSDPVPGGRRRPDGVEVRWAISTAEKTDGLADRGKSPSLEAGELPFWCLDRTPRGLRVPYLKVGNAKHRCGAVGLASVVVSLRDVPNLDGVLAKRKLAYDAIFDVTGQQTPGGGWSWDSPVPDPQSPSPCRVTLLSKNGTRPVADSHVDIHISLFTRGAVGNVGGYVDDEHTHFLSIDLVSEGGLLK
jgi:hypothetical protein